MATVLPETRAAALAALAAQHGPIAAAAVEGSVWEACAGDVDTYHGRFLAALCVGHGDAAAVAAPGGVDAAVAAADARGMLAAALHAHASAHEAAERARTAVMSGVACKCGSRDVRVRTQQTRSADEARLGFTTMTALRALFLTHARGQGATTFYACQQCGHDWRKG